MSERQPSPTNVLITQFSDRLRSLASLGSDIDAGPAVQACLAFVDERQQNGTIDLATGDSLRLGILRSLVTADRSTDHAEPVLRAIAIPSMVIDACEVLSDSLLGTFSGQHVRLMLRRHFTRERLTNYERALRDRLILREPSSPMIDELEQQFIAQRVETDSVTGWLESMGLDASLSRGALLDIQWGGTELRVRQHIMASILEVQQLCLAGASDDSVTQQSSRLMAYIDMCAQRDPDLPIWDTVRQDISLALLAGSRPEQTLRVASRINKLLTRASVAIEFCKATRHDLGLALCNDDRLTVEQRITLLESVGGYFIETTDDMDIGAWDRFTRLARNLREQYDIPDDTVETPDDPHTPSTK